MKQLWFDRVIWYLIVNIPWFIMWIVMLKIVGWHAVWITLGFAVVSGWETGAKEYKEEWFYDRRQRTPRG